MKTQQNSRGLAALADLLIKVPSALRESTRDSTELLLRELGFDPAEHQYLFGTRFRDRVPELRTVKAGGQRRYFFTMCDGSAKEQRYSLPWAEGQTSLEELIKFLGRTEAMVRKYLREDLYRDREGAAAIQHRRSPNGVLRIWDTPDKVVIDDVPNLFEALALRPTPKQRGSY